MLQVTRMQDISVGSVDMGTRDMLETFALGSRYDNGERRLEFSSAL